MKNCNGNTATVTAMHRNKVKKTNKTALLTDTQEDVRACGGYVDRSCQHLNPEAEKNPPLARFAESSPTNWVTHGSNAASSTHPHYHWASLILGGAKVQNNCAKGESDLAHERHSALEHQNKLWCMNVVPLAAVALKQRLSNLWVALPI